MQRLVLVFFLLISNAFAQEVDLKANVSDDTNILRESGAPFLKETIPAFLERIEI